MKANVNSKRAVKLYAMAQAGQIKSRAMFWKNFSDPKVIDEQVINSSPYEAILDKNKIRLSCCFDDDFPKIRGNVKLFEQPFLLAYRGDLSLLNKECNNIAIVGTTSPTIEVIKREQKIICNVCKGGFNIISGLANGCDSVAHAKCLQMGCKTIAFLPTTLEYIYPKSNTLLVDEIVNSGGLIVTEYVSEAKSNWEQIGWFIERDRLQAMFSKAVILIASHQPGKGDSGSRHAMNKAKQYGKLQYVMYNQHSDSDNPIFDLNKLLISQGAQILTPKTLQNLIDFKKSN